MLSNVTAKTGWAPKQQIVAILVCLIVLAVVFWVSPGSDSYSLRVDGHHYSLEPAATAVQQERGLSGRSSIDADEGMLFIYQRESQQCIWMKDMKFPLDIIWADAARKVVHLEHNVSPSTYPKTFCSPGPATFVIELNAGEAAKAGIHKGQILKF